MHEKLCFILIIYFLRANLVLPLIIHEGVVPDHNPLSWHWIVSVPIRSNPSLHAYTATSLNVVPVGVLTEPLSGASGILQSDKQMFLTNGIDTVRCHTYVIILSFH